MNLTAPLMNAIARTAADLITAGAMTADAIDWDLVRTVHIARLEKLYEENADYILEQVWIRANSKTHRGASA